MSESLEDILQLGEELDGRLAEIEDKLEEQMNNIVDLSRIGSIFTSLMDLELMLPMLMETALRVVKGEVGAVTIFDEPENKTANWGLSPEIINHLTCPDSQNVFEKVVHDKETLILEDFMLRGMDETEIPKFSISSLIVSPIKAEEKVVGIIFIANKEDDQIFDVDDTFVLELLGSFAAVSVMNIKNHRQALQKQKMDQELKMAEFVQSTLMPEEKIELDGVNVYAFNSQAGEVGGDFYDVITINPNKHIIIVGDVSSKGVPAALLMACARSYFRVVSESINSAAELVTKVNKYICRDMQDLNGMFITLFAALIDLEENKLYSVNAGHPPGYLFENDDIHKLKKGGPFVGQFEEVEYSESVTELKGPANLVIYTDGLFECVNKEGEMLGLDGSFEFLKSNSHNDWNLFVKNIEKLMKEYSFDPSRVDDTTLLRVEICNDGKN